MWTPPALSYHLGREPQGTWWPPPSGQLCLSQTGAHRRVTILHTPYWALQAAFLSGRPLRPRAGSPALLSTPPRRLGPTRALANSMGSLFLSQGKAASCSWRKPPDPAQDGVPTGFNLHSSTSCSHKPSTVSHRVLPQSAQNLRVQDSGAGGGGSSVTGTTSSD